MNLTSIRRFRAPAAALALGLALTACGAANEEPTGGSGEDSGASGLSGTLNGGGASSQEAAQNAWRAGFQEANPAVTQFQSVLANSHSNIGALLSATGKPAMRSASSRTMERAVIGVPS